MNEYNQEGNNIRLVKGTSIGSSNMYRAKLIDDSGGEIASTKVNFTKEGDAIGSKAPCFFVEFNNVLYINVNGKYMPFHDDSARVTKMPDGYVIEFDYGDKIFSALVLEKYLDVLSQDEDYINVRFEVGKPRYHDKENYDQKKLDSSQRQVKVVDAKSGEDIGVLDDMHNTFSILGGKDIFLITHGSEPVKHNYDDISRIKKAQGKYVLDVNNQYGMVPEDQIKFSENGKKMVDSYFHKANDNEKKMQDDMLPVMNDEEMQGDMLPVMNVQEFDVNKFVDLMWSKIFDGTLNAGTSHGIRLNSRVYYGDECYKKDEPHQITVEKANQILDDSGIHYTLSNIDLNALI